MNGNNSVQVLNSFSGIYKQLSISVTLVTGKQKYNLSDAQNTQTLQGTLLQNIINLANSSITVDSQGNTLCAQAITDSAYLFLKMTNGATLVLDGTPLAMFKRENVNMPIQAFCDTEVDWQNSYIQTQAPILVGENNHVLQFFVNFKEKQS